MGPNPFIGVIYHWIGGFASATNFIPFRGIKRWSWEIYWLIQGFAAWIVAPTLLGSIFVPNLFGIIHQVYVTNPKNVLLAFLFGVLWGVGGITFGLAIRYLGIALGYAIALGLCAAFGTVVPPIAHGQFGAILHSTAGQIILLGVLVCLIGVAVNGAAGVSKEREITPEEKAEAGETDYNFGKGIAIAILAGFMSSFFAFGLDAGKPIGDLARTQLLAAGRLDLWQNLPILVVVLWGGFVTNFIWSAILIFQNGSVRQFAGEPGSNPMRATHATGQTLVDFDPLDPSTYDRLAPRTLIANYIFAALAGVIWYFQFFFYSMGQTKMGKYDFSSWTLHMASIIIFATLWGLFLKEWRGTSRRTKTLVATGLFLLISSTVVVGYGNYLKANQDGIKIISTQLILSSPKTH
ncbi:L-rhamnose-H+ transport protein [Edaphobacter aggregans]|uniref:L-rhamnose-H+ transport protein n=1 Tax=Edaphobacter aggregans TaxID=570835 RepID=A0A3R9P7E5_9BACT|nr:L-rhamnose/proton symporter RhaT [Edaphobacter aggregans]RSL15169.1 L-rhamnose-H+ transport protein [Edaphobacter aggregans]